MSCRGVGVGDVATQIRRATLTGWTQSGRAWCHAFPAVICSLAGYAGELQTVDPPAYLLPSSFYDLGTWSFHATGFTATPFVFSSSTSEPGTNQQWLLRGRRLASPTAPALPLAAVLGIATGIGSGAWRRVRHR